MTTLDRYTCKEVLRRLNDYLDRELTSAEMRMVEVHLATCTACASEHRFEAAVIDEVRRKLRRIDVPASVIDKVTGALDRARRELA